MQDWTWVNEIVRVATLAHDAAGAGMVSNDKDITEAYRNDLGRLVALVEVGIAHGYVDAEGVLQDRPLASGDVVQLKSGGPAMTVSKLGATDDGSAALRCLWTDNTGEPRSNVFPLACLRRVEPPVAPVAASAEPDAWQEDTREPRVACPDGYEPAGGWVEQFTLSAGLWSPSWRRRLRKVSP